MRLFLPRRKTLLAATALICALAAGCSDDDNSSQPLSDASIEDTGDVEQPDVSDVGDVGADTDVSDGGDVNDTDDAVDTADAEDTGPDIGGPFSAESVVRLASTMEDFKSINEQYGLNFSGRTTRSGPFDGASFGFLYDFSDPSDVKLSDRLMVESGYLYGTVVDGRVVTGWAGINEEDEWEITATSYDVSEGSFEVVDELDVTPEGDRSCTLLEVVTNQEAIALVCFEMILELRMDEQGELEMVGWVDRLEEADDLHDGIMWLRDQNYDMAPDGHVFEYERRLLVWRLPSMMDDAASEDGAPSVLAAWLVPENVAGPAPAWHYRRDLNLVYTCGAYGSHYPDTGYVIDVSEPTAPTIVSEWEALDDFGEYANGCQGATSSGDLLFFRYTGLEHGPTPALWSFDIGTDPHNPAPLDLRALNELPGFRGRTVRNLATHNGYLLFRRMRDQTPTYPSLDIYTLPLSYFEQE